MSQRASVKGALSAAGASEIFKPTHAEGFNVSLWGVFVGTVQVERTFDQGATWLPLTDLGSPVTFAAPCTEVLDEPEPGVAYRVNCTSYTSGTINYRISQ